MEITQCADIVLFVLFYNQNQIEMQSEKQGAKTREEMAVEYNVSRKTFYRWLKKADIQLSNGNLTPKEQALIYEKFGKPKGSANEEESTYDMSQNDPK